MAVLVVVAAAAAQGPLQALVRHHHHQHLRPPGSDRLSAAAPAPGGPTSSCAAVAAPSAVAELQLPGASRWVRTRRSLFNGCGNGAICCDNAEVQSRADRSSSVRVCCVCIVNTVRCSCFWLPQATDLPCVGGGWQLCHRFRRGHSGGGFNFDFRQASTGVNVRLHHPGIKSSSCGCANTSWRALIAGRMSAGVSWRCA